MPINNLVIFRTYIFFSFLYYSTRNKERNYVFIVKTNIYILKKKNK